MRRFSSIAAVVALAVVGFGAIAQPASAGKPIKIFEHRVGFVCEEPWLSNEDGVAITAASVSSESGPEAIVLYWAPPETPETAEATLRSTTDVPEVTVDGLHLDAVVPMEDQDFNPVGDAIISADLVPVGEPELGAGKTREGNRTIRDNTVNQPLVVESGTLTLPNGVVFDLAGCPGSDLTIDIRISNPSQFVITHSGILVLCDIATDDYVVNLGASTDGANVGGEVFYADANQALGGFSEDLTLTSEVFSGAFDLINFETEEPAGTAVLDATLTQGEHVVLKTTGDGPQSKMIGYLLEVTGTLTIPTDPATVVDLSSCFAFDGKEQIKEHRPDEEPEE
ncbi:MAG: hypothetical protein ACRDKG_11095 [Actinomycetota bacterium]